MNWATFFAAVIMFESGGDMHAFNKAEKTYGPMQITPIAVQDINRIYGTDLKQEECSSEAISEWAFIAYGMAYGAETQEEFYRIWNGGPDGMSEEKTEENWNKVLLEAERLIRKRR